MFVVDNMGAYDIFSPEYDCNFFKFKEGQEGYFYDHALNTLIKGKIENFRLKGTVVHDGFTIEMPLTSFSIGYSYDMWDLRYVVWFPTDIKKCDGFLKWLNNPNTNYDKIKVYFTKAKQLIDQLK